MATAKKLQSGNWRCRAYDKTTGSTKSFTASTKREAERMAAAWLCGSRSTPVGAITLGEAIDKYCDMKSNILSPTTLEKYRSIRNNQISQTLLSKPIRKITTVMLQNEINRLSGKYAPKTVSNANGLIMSVLHVYVPDSVFNITLPAKQKRLRELPTPEIIYATFKDSPIFLEVLLAMWLGLRVSEIRGLKKSDFRNKKVYIERSVVTVGTQNVVKPYPKTVESRRVLSVPDQIQQIVDDLTTDNITTRSRASIYKSFKRRITKAGYPDTTFHDLRHINASVMLAIGIPDKYAMERGGWSTPHVMKTVYQETFKSEREKVDDKINEYFSSLATKLATNEK